MSDQKDRAFSPEDAQPKDDSPETPRHEGAAAKDESRGNEPTEAEVEAPPALSPIKVHSHGPFQLQDGFVPDHEEDTRPDPGAGKKTRKRGGIDLAKVAAVAEVDRLAEINILSAVEALLFAAETPVTPAQIAKAIEGVKPSTVKKSILALKDGYEERDAGFEVVEEAGGWTILTREDFAPYIRALHNATEAKKLSAAALETLAVVAYKQPVQRAEIEDVRGVGCGPMLRTLMEKDLVKTAGRAEALGRPLLYGTTKRFLKTFGLGSLKDLPKAGEVGAG